MSFHASASEIELEDDHILKVTFEDGSESTLDLNQVIGNNDGNFQWGGENFADSASDIELHREGDDDVPVLRANLGTIDGDENAADINLGERIANEDGELVFKEEE
ncbi:hypothetical protein N7478_007537 [Penicillium angulare]|uniref:uncharacterized protein n=1 Tax=Penicillium angulare TaxID=116970 RepID=UPI00253FDD6C|nr:uncharacterized protein N7478_007537 [Penicillium angulare]KAJ5272412.1 hypothetical protein N7478_007537 [Penicillium angulare]